MMTWPLIKYGWPTPDEWEDDAAVYRLAAERQAEDHRRYRAMAMEPAPASRDDRPRYHVTVRWPDGRESESVRDPSRPYAATIGALTEAPTTVAPPIIATLDNPSPPRIVEGKRCPGCGKRDTVEVVYGSVTHVHQRWARAVYTCCCCEWSEVKGQR